jgi:hypothetical protein
MRERWSVSDSGKHVHHIEESTHWRWSIDRVLIFLLLDDLQLDLDQSIPSRPERLSGTCSPQNIAVIFWAARVCTVIRSAVAHDGRCTKSALRGVSSDSASR